MDRRGGKTFSLIATAALVALNVVALNVWMDAVSGARVDLTADRLYSISDATERVLEGLEEDVVVFGYFSERTHPKLAPLVPRIEDMLDEYRAVSGGKVEVEMIDPSKDDVAAREAADRFGVRSTPFQLASKYETGIVNAYFSLVVKYADAYERYGFDELIDVEPTPDGSDIEVRLRNLEYDLTRAIRKVVAEFERDRDLFASLDAPVRLTAVVTPDRLPEVFAEVPETVREAAAELGEKAGDRFEYEAIDPTGDDALADRLYERYGVRPMSLGLLGDEPFYLNAILEVGDDAEQLVLAVDDLTAAEVREAVEQSVRRRSPGALRKVGIFAPTAEIPVELRMQYQMQGRTPPPPQPEYVELERFLEADYRLERVDLASDAVPYDVDVVVVIGPRQMDEAEVFRLDQFLMRGGRVVIAAGKTDVELDRTGIRVEPVETGLDAWLAHHGVSIEPELVLDDRNEPLPIPEDVQTPFGTLRSWRMAPYPYLVQVRDEGLSEPRVASAIDAVGLYWPHPLSVDETRTEDLEVTPLLVSSDASWTSDDYAAAKYVDYAVPPDDTLEPSVLAVSLAGRFTSYFADRGAPEAIGETAVLGASPDTRLVVVGNAEWLSDFVATAIGRMEGGYFVENLRYAQNLIDWTTLDNDLVAIRSRDAAGRRIERVDPGARVAIETVNYAIPTFLLIGIGGWTWHRRRNAEPLDIGR